MLCGLWDAVPRGVRPVSPTTLYNNGDRKPNINQIQNTNFTIKTSQNMDKKSPQFTVRPAEEADAAAIASIGARVFAASFGHSVEDENMAAFVDQTYRPEPVLRNIRDPKQSILVAESTALATKGEVAGFGILIRDTTEPCLVSYPTHVELQRLYVDSKYQGCGIGKALILALENIARQEGYAVIWLGVWEGNPDAIRLYTGCGYKKIGEHGFQMGQRVDNDWVVMKYL